MNIRQTAGLDPNYYEINREERNYAAILFAALCKPENAEKFLSLCEIYEKPGPDFGIYFEYAYLRDIWSAIEGKEGSAKDWTFEKREETKKAIIRNHLDIKGIAKILSLPVVEINRRFGVSGRPSEDYVQFPGKWAIGKYSKNFTDNDDFLEICKFKWAFNIKPDIVIHLDKDRAICIEAKYESGEGSYPSSKIDRDEFDKRNKVKRVGQLALQKYMMEKLLGLETKFVYLLKDGANYVPRNDEKDTPPLIKTWAEAFDGLDMSDMPLFARKMAENISRKNEK